MTGWKIIEMNMFGRFPVKHCIKVLSPLHESQSGELSKKRHYKDLEWDYIFVPVAIETSGSWGKEALSFIKTIGKKIFTSTDEPKSTSYLIQRICHQLHNYLNGHNNRVAF
jgi:hypothetical protein